MSYESVKSTPSTSFKCEANAFLAALERTSPDAITACSGWTAHEIVAHLAAAGIEVALNLEAYGEGRSIPSTRGFEEREAPFREMNDHLLRLELPKSIARMSSALDAVLSNEPDAVVPWTGRQMVVKTFLTHLRSEFAIHRFDLIGDDEITKELLAQPDLTNHAVTVLGKALLLRASNPESRAFRATIASPGASDVAVVVDAEGSRLIHAEDLSEPSVIGDQAARLLFLWGREPGDPSRLKAPGGPDVLRRLQTLLAGY